MFDSFEYENVNYKLFDQGVVEEDDDEYTDIRKNLNNSFRFNSNNADFTHLNQFVDATFNKILNKPIEVLKSSQQIEKNNKKSLKEKLFDIYLEESTSNTATTASFQKLNFSTHLLQKFVERENSNTLILNFYPINKGYSIGFNIKHLNSSIDQNNNETNKSHTADSDLLANFNSIETKLISYDETELLYYINAGEIPPVMIDLIDRLNVNLYNDGCIILEIHDYRRYSIMSNNTSIKNYDVEYILLQPSMQTLLADLNSITNDGNFIWTQEDKYTLESQLILATAQPLCLHPSPIVSVLKYKFHNHKYKLNDRKLKKAVYKFTNVYLNRASRSNEYAMPMPFHIRKIRKKYSKTNEYLHFQTGPSATELNNANNTNKNLDGTLKRQLNIPVNSTSPSSFLITSLNFQSVDNWSKAEQPLFNLPREDMILVKKFAKTVERPKLSTNTDHTLIPIEEIILEAVDKTTKNNYSKLLIKRRSTDEVYFCQLGLCSDQTNEVVFRLGLANEAEKYIEQYIKIFTEEGRRAVSITKKNLTGSPHFAYSNNFGENVSSAFTFFPPRSQQQSQQTSLTSSNTFQSYFKNKKSLLDFNDKQLQTYQNFFYQQQQQQQNLQQQQLASIQKNKQLQIQQQQQLQNQIKRIKNSNDEQNSKSSLTDSINTNAHKFNTNQMTRVSSAINSVTKINKNDQIKTEPVQITNTTSSSSLTSFKKQKFTSVAESASALKPKQETVFINKPVQRPIISPQLTPLSSKVSNPKLQPTPNTNFVQIYVPKIAVTSQQQTTINTAKTSHPPASTKKTYAKKRASSALKAPDTGEKKKQATALDTETLPTPISTLVPPKPEQQQPALLKSISISQSNPNAKIINASHFNLMRKIAIDSRSMPVIVTLNSAGDTNDLNHQTIQQQLKLKSHQNQQQQNNKQIKLVNSRLTLKPAITNNNNNLTEKIKNDNLKNDTASPIKTFQFQKSSPILKHLSFHTYGSQNQIQGIKPTLSSNSTNILSTIPINSSNVKPTTSNLLNTDLVGNDGTKSFVVNSSQIGTQIRQGIGIQSNIGSTTIMKPSFVIKNINEKEKND